MSIQRLRCPTPPSSSNGLPSGGIGNTAGRRCWPLGQTFAEDRLTENVENDIWRKPSSILQRLGGQQTEEILVTSILSAGCSVAQLSLVYAKALVSYPSVIAL